jgi:hypothetical protein
MALLFEQLRYVKACLHFYVRLTMIRKCGEELAIFPPRGHSCSLSTYSLESSLVLALVEVSLAVCLLLVPAESGPSSQSAAFNVEWQGFVIACAVFFNATLRFGLISDFNYFFGQSQNYEGVQVLLAFNFF